MRTWLDDHGIKCSLSYEQQGFLNLQGGRDTERPFKQSGSYDLILRFDSEKMGLWEGGYGYIKAKGNWRESLGFGSTKVGSLSRVNVDEGEDDPIFISKWWVGQTFLDGFFDLRLGRLESRKDLFDLNEYARHEDFQFFNEWLRANPTVPHTTAGDVFLAGVRLRLIF